MAATDTYVCSLDERSLDKSRKELHENPEDRVQALDKLKELIKERKWLKSPTDYQFVMQFLRVRKFSQMESLKTIEKYWTFREENPKWFLHCDPAHDVMQEVLKLGLYLPLPGRDDQGRKVFLFNFANFDPSNTKLKPDDYFKTCWSIFDILNRDENTQVNGFVFFVDATFMTLKAQTFFGVNRSITAIKGWTGAYPTRFKMIIYYNVDPVFRAFFDLVKHAFTEKLRSRISLHGKSMAPIYDIIPKRMLPQEYLPDDHVGPSAGTLAEIAENNRTHIMEPQNREYLMRLSGGEYGVDLSQKPKGVEVEQGSFRKINND